MTIKRIILTVLTIVSLTLTATAGVGKPATITAKSESGKVELTVKLSDVDGPVSSAQLTTEQGTWDLTADYDAYSVIDVPNHIITICFQQKGKPADAPDAKVIKTWAIPSSFVKTTTGDFGWRFKIKVGGNMLKEVTSLSGTFDAN